MMRAATQRMCLMRAVLSKNSSATMQLLLVAAFGLLALRSGQVMADDLLGLYVGGAIGQSQVEATSPQFLDSGHYQLLGAGSFKENHSAFKVMVGVRPISLLGAELAYVDLGHPTG